MCVYARMLIETERERERGGRRVQCPKGGKREIDREREGWEKSTVSKGGKEREIER